MSKVSQVAALIRHARITAGLSQTDLAQRAGTSQPALARYETGATVPRLPTLERLLSGCGRRLDLRARWITEPSLFSASMSGELGAQLERVRRGRRRLLQAARKRGVRRVRIFGSLARADVTPGSDVDLLVELDRSRTLLDLVAFQREAEEILGMRVDVATPDMLKDRIRAKAEAEAVPV